MGGGAHHRVRLKTTDHEMAKTFFNDYAKDIEDMASIVCHSVLLAILM